MNCQICDQGARCQEENCTVKGITVSNVKVWYCDGCGHGWLPIAEELRIDVLTDNYAGWIKVPKFKEDTSLSWEDRYAALEKHHIDETTFLIDCIKQLYKEGKPCL